MGKCNETIILRTKRFLKFGSISGSNSKNGDLTTHSHSKSSFKITFPKLNSNQTVIFLFPFSPPSLPSYFFFLPLHYICLFIFCSLLHWNKTKWPFLMFLPLKAHFIPPPRYLFTFDNIIYMYECMYIYIELMIINVLIFYICRLIRLWKQRKRFSGKGLLLILKAKPKKWGHLFFRCYIYYF